MPSYRITARTNDGGWRELPPVEADSTEQVAAFVMKLFAHTPWSEAILTIKES